MAFLRSALVKDLRRHVRDPWSLGVMLAIPFVIGTLITLVVGGSSGPQPVAKLLLVDEDDSFLSGMLAGAFTQEASNMPVRGEVVERDEGLARIRAGDGSALVIIPEGFGDAVLKEEPTELAVLKNPAQRILPGIIEEGLSVLVDGTFYAHRVLGEELKEIVEGPPDGATMFADADVARISVSINNAVRRLEKYLMPPVIELETHVDDEEGGRTDVPFGALYLPGVVFMALFFAAQALSDDVWAEREQGTLRRLVSSPQPVASMLLAKVLCGVLIIVAVCAAGLVIGTAYFGLNWANAPLAALWSGLSGAVLLLLMMLLQLFASTRRAGAIILTVIMFPLLMLGGSFFPFEAMPKWMADLGRLTPNGWSVEQLKAILLDRAEIANLALAAGVLVAMGAVLFLLCARRVRFFAQG